MTEADIRVVTVEEIISKIHPLALSVGGGSSGIRDRGALESAVGRMHASGWGVALYPSLPEKAAALAFFLIMNHPFVDGNKRSAALAMGLFLSRNGLTVTASEDELLVVFLSVAKGETVLPVFTDRVRDWVSPDI